MDERVVHPAGEESNGVLVPVSEPIAPRKEEVLGTVMLSVLSGHQRYAHIGALHGTA